MWIVWLTCSWCLVPHLRRCFTRASFISPYLQAPLCCSQTLHSPWENIWWFNMGPLWRIEHFPIHHAFLLMLLPFSAITLKKADNIAAILPRQLIFWALHGGLPDLGWRGIYLAPCRQEQTCIHRQHPLENALHHPFVCGCWELLFCSSWEKGISHSLFQWETKDKLIYQEPDLPLSATALLFPAVMICKLLPVSCRQCQSLHWIMC